MPINVVYEYAGRGHLRHFFSKLMRFVGGVLILIGLMASVLPLLVLVGMVLSALEGKSITFRDQDVINVGIAVVIMIVSLVLGRSLMRGRRQLVLFLRRFGFVGATETLTFALATAMGNSWRLVTLDDNQIAPVGAGRKVRWTSVIVGILAISIITAAVYWARSGGLEDVMKGAMTQGARQDNLAGSIVGAIVAALAVAIIFAVLILVASTFLAVLAIFSFGTYISVRRAEKSKKLQVSSLKKIDPMARSVERRSRRVLSPRLIVVRVAAEVWRETVHRLALISAAIIIDVSEPTPNLLWEIETLKPNLRGHWILVAEQEHLNEFSTMPGARKEINYRLLTMLDGEDILAYSSDRKGRKRFARALRARLEQLSRRSRAN
jgi:hypothetical protein